MGFETICEGGELRGGVNDDSGYLAVDLGGPGLWVVRGDLDRVVNLMMHNIYIYSDF